MNNAPNPETPEGPEGPAPDPLEAFLAEAIGSAPILDHSVSQFVSQMLYQQAAILKQYGLQTFTDGAGRVRSFKAPDLVEITDEAEPVHKFSTLESFLRYALQDASPDLAAVFISPEAVILKLNRKLFRGTATWPLEESKSWKRWVGRKLAQAEFADLLETWGEAELVMGDDARNGAQMNLEKLSISKAVKFDATSRHGQVVSLSYSVEGQDPSSAKLPLLWAVRVPRHTGGPLLDVELRLKLQLIDGRPPEFLLECPKLAAYEEAAFELALREVQDKLPGFLVFRGEPAAKGAKS